MFLWKEEIPFEKHIQSKIHRLLQLVRQIKHVRDKRRNKLLALDLTGFCWESQRRSPVSAFWSPPLSSCLISYILRRPWGQRYTCTPSTFRRLLAVSSYWLTRKDTTFSSEETNCSCRLWTASMLSCSHLLSWIWPSTLCSSFPNMPHGLKFNTHLSPVLMKDIKTEINSSIKNRCISQFKYCTFALWLYLWLIISTVPYCSIQSFPKMILCTQHIGFVHVYTSLCLQENHRINIVEKYPHSLYFQESEEKSSTFNYEARLLDDHRDWKHGTTIAIITVIMYILDVRSWVY